MLIMILKLLRFSIFYYKFFIQFSFNNLIKYLGMTFRPILLVILSCFHAYSECIVLRPRFSRMFILKLCFWKKLVLMVPCFYIFMLSNFPWTPQISNVAFVIIEFFHTLSLFSCFLLPSYFSRFHCFFLKI